MLRVGRGSVTKAELIRQLDGLADETEVIVWAETHGELQPLRIAYQPMTGLRAAFVYLVAKESTQETRVEPADEV